MNRSADMLSFPLFAEAPPASWMGALYGFLSGAGLALLAWLLKRQGEQSDARRERHKRLEEGDSAVEIENIRSLQDLQRQRNADLGRLQGEMSAMRLHYDQCITKLERRVTILTTFFYQLHAATMLLQQGWRIMRARLKRKDPEFDEAEFPEPDLEKFDPVKLLAQLEAPVSVTVFPSPSDPSKSTTVTEHGDGSVEVR